jgi:hypothetical protein
MNKQNDNVLIERLNGNMSVIDKNLFEKYIENEEIYQLIPLDKNARGIYKNYG